MRWFVLQNTKKMTSDTFDTNKLNAKFYSQWTMKEQIMLINSCRNINDLKKQVTVIYFLHHCILLSRADMSLSAVNKLFYEK